MVQINTDFFTYFFLLSVPIRLIRAIRVLFSFSPFII